MELECESTNKTHPLNRSHTLAKASDEESVTELARFCSELGCTLIEPSMFHDLVGFYTQKTTTNTSFIFRGLFGAFVGSAGTPM